MTENRTSLHRLFFFATCLTLGCTGSGAAGCGSSGGNDANVDTELFGVYQVTAYRFSENGCDEELTNAQQLGRFVLYPADETDEALIVGGFCSDVDGCRTRAREKPPTVNYAFFRGNDASGWQGWGVVSQGAVGEMCQIDVQAHSLTVPSQGAIRIDTRQVETLFTGDIDTTTNEAVCNARDAVANIREDSPCQAVFELEADYETRL